MKKAKKFLFGLLCFVLIFSLALPISSPAKAEASPATIYVPDDYLTIQAAIDAANPGDTIIVRDGTYTENVDLNKDHLTIQSENGAEVTIVQAANPNYHVFEITDDYVNISGFTIKEATADEKAGICLSNVEYCHVSGNICHNNYHGILLNSSPNNTLEDNTCFSNYWSGILLSFSSNNTVENNSCSESTYFGIGLHSSSNNILENNNCFKNHYLGICLSLSSNSNIVKSNIISENNDGICLQYSSNSNIVEDNTCSGNVFDGILLSYSASNNNVKDNTCSGNSYGIHLLSSSVNTIYINNFIDNVDNVYSDDSANLWNSPEEITYTYNGNTYTSYLGNYWSGYGIYLPAVGHDDPDDQWEDEMLAYDENRNTYARVYVTSIDTSWLELLAPPGKSTQRIRFWGSGGPLQVDIYCDGNWYCLKDWSWGVSSAPANEWVELTYPSKIVEKARIKFHGRVLSGWSHLSEFQFKTSPADADNDGIGDSPYSINSDKDNYPLMEPFENYVIGATDTTPPEAEITSGPSGTIDYNDVAFTWTGSDDATPTTELVYSYILEPYDSDWSPWTSDTSKQYTDLPDGAYNFRVKVRDEADNTDPTPGIRVFTVAVKWEKSVNVIPGAILPGSEIGAKVSYNWVGVDEQGENVFQIYRIEGWSHYFVGAYRISIENEFGTLWSKLIPATPLWMTYYPKELYAHADDWISVKAYGFTEKEALGLWSITAKWAGIPTPPPGGLPFFIGHDEEYLAPPYIDTSGFPSIGEEGEVYPMILGCFCSPGELRIYDTQGRVTGLVNGEVREEIPNSAYFNGIFVLLSLNDSYRYEVVGTEEKEYKIGVVSAEAEEANAFVATDIPTSANAIHQYTIDWDALSLGEEGVTLQVDSDGDGVFDHTLTASNELTGDEFILQTETIIDFDPDTLNLKSKGKWVTAYIELPEGYDPSQIDISSIRLNDKVAALAKPTQIGDYDGDGIPDLMVKFDRASVTALFDGKTIPRNYVVEVTGTIAGIHFKGTTSIRVISP